MKIRWPRLTFPPINLWTAPHQPALEETMTEAAESDSVQDQLCARIDELEVEKEALAAQIDRLEEDLAETKRAKAVIRDNFATQVQQAVARARRDWAAQGSPWVKARWQAEALESLWPRLVTKADQQITRHHARELRRQAEGGE